MDCELEFDKDGPTASTSEEIYEPDQELLQIQRRKSQPRVVIEEFVAKEDGDDSDGNDSGEEQKNDQMSPGIGKLTRLKTHVEIDDFAELGSDIPHFGLHEISPLERLHDNDASPTLNKEEQKTIDKPSL